MSTIIWFTGFEYGGVMSINGGGLCDAITGSPSVVASAAGTLAAHTGSYHLRCASNSYITRNFTAGKTAVTRIYFKINTTLSNYDVGVFSITTVGHKIQFTYDTTLKVLYIGIDGAKTTAGSSIAADTWYCLEVKANTIANPWLVDWQIDSIAQTQLSYAHAAENMSAINIGLVTAVATGIGYFDDVALSVTAGDYPIGPGGTFGLRPNADGTHNNGPNILEDNSGNDIDGVTYFAWSRLDEKPWASAFSDWVRQQNVGAANYCEIQFEDMSVALINLFGVEALLEYGASGTTANNGGCIIRDNSGTETEVWGKSGGLKDYSETSAFYKHAVVTVPGGGWNKTEVDALRCRFGYSTNVATKPYWIATMLEVGYLMPTVSLVVTNDAIMIGQTPSTPEERVTNFAIDIAHEVENKQLQVTNFAIIVAWRPPGTLNYDLEQVI